MSQGKENGGLGIRKLDLLNRALLGKWAYRFIVEGNSIWKACINSKYGTEEGGVVLFFT